MKKVYFFCSHTVPTEHPNGVRFANIGQIFRELGYQVYLIGCDDRGEREFAYKDMICKVFYQPITSGFLASQKREHHRYEYIRKFISDNGAPDCLVTGLFNCKAQRYLLTYCKRHNIKMIASVCEWFDKNNYQGLKGMLKFINNRYSMYVQNPKIRNIIGISTMLCNYYKTKNCSTIYVPTLIDAEEYKDVTYSEHDKLSIAYAGAPAKKDYIVNVIQAMGLLNIEEKEKIELNLYGITQEDLLALGITQDFLFDNRNIVICKGRIPYREVKEKIAKADFTVLLRPNKRYANAGFPTKVGESMACGTPVIANITSDLGKYILDEKTGLVCINETPEACAECIRRAMKKNIEELLEMRQMALEMSKNGFDYHSYIGAMEQFLSDK